MGGGGGVQICEGGLNPIADFVPRGSKSATSGFVPGGRNLGGLNSLGHP